MRRRGMGLGAWAAVAVLLLSGCAADAEEPPAAADQSQAKPGGKKKDSGTSDSDSDVSDLAAMAEALAQSDEGDDIAPRADEVIGADISWPQCPPGMGIPEKRSSGQPMPEPDAEFVIVGLTNGPGFTPNPCLADQVDWVEDHRLLLAAYAVVSYPGVSEVEEYGDQGPFDSETRMGRLKNVGYQQARYNIGSIGSAGMKTPIVWIDVEPVPHFAWSQDLEANAAVVQGTARGYLDSGYQIGIYSTPALWAGVVGGLRLEVPEWRAAGQTSKQEALSRCGDDWSIQGGKAIFGQWVENRRDKNVTCPGSSTDLGTWFSQS